jgi:hypothetical protein
MFTLLTASFGQCRTPLWGDFTPPLEQAFVCGRPSLDGKSYCAGCRELLIAGHSRPDGSAAWFKLLDEKKAGVAIRKETAPTNKALLG